MGLHQQLAVLGGTSHSGREARLSRHVHAGNRDRGEYQLHGDVAKQGVWRQGGVRGVVDEVLVVMKRTGVPCISASVCSFSCSTIQIYA